jgi:hypothetical protein
VQGRARRRPVEEALQRLAVDGEHPLAARGQVVEKRPEGLPEGGRVEQADDAADRVVARQTVLQAQEFLQERLAILGELSEVDATLGATDRGDERDRQIVEQRVPLRIPPPRVGDLPIFSISAIRFLDLRNQ